jgi:hypothetical protein
MDRSSDRNARSPVYSMLVLVVGMAAVAYGGRHAPVVVGAGLTAGGAAIIYLGIYARSPSFRARERERSDRWSRHPRRKFDPALSVTGAALIATVILVAVATESGALGVIVGAVLSVLAIAVLVQLRR